MQVWLSNGNVKAGSLAALIFVYIILALSVWSIPYYETIHRVTYRKVFDFSLFGSTLADSLACVGLFLLFLATTFRSKPARAIMVADFAIAIYAYATNFQPLQWAGLATVPVIAALLIIGWRVRKNKKGLLSFEEVAVNHISFAIAFLAIITIMEIGAVTRWILYPVFPSEIYVGDSWRIAELESALFHTFALLSPILVVLISFSFLYRDQLVAIKRYIRSAIGRRRIEKTEKSKHLTEESYNFISKEKQDSESVYEEKAHVTLSAVSKRTRVSQSIHRPIFLFAIIASFLVAIYAQFVAVDMAPTGISTDEKFYVEALTQMRLLAGANGERLSDSVGWAFAAIGGDRPLTLLAMLGLAQLTSLPATTIVRFLPAVLAPAFVATVYYTVKHSIAPNEATSGSNGRKKIAVIAALIAAFSPQIVVGIYAGILANWLALIPAMFAMMLAVRLWNRLAESGVDHVSRRNFAVNASLLFGVLVSVMLFHVYTWGYLILTIALFSFIAYVTRRKIFQKKYLALTLAIIAVAIVGSIIVDLLKSNISGSPTGLERDALLANRLIDFNNFGARWDTLNATLKFYVGGFLSNPVLIVLTLIWILQARSQSALAQFVYAMIILFSIPILGGNTVLQARVLYNWLLFIPAAFVIYNSRLRKELFIAVVLVMAVYSLHAMANLYLVLPEGYEPETPFLMP